MTAEVVVAEDHREGHFLVPSTISTSGSGGNQNQIGNINLTPMRYFIIRIV